MQGLLCLNNSDQVLVVDSNNVALRLVSSSTGMVTTMSVIGEHSNANFAFAVQYPNGNIFITDFGHRVSMLTLTGAEALINVFNVFGDLLTLQVSCTHLQGVTESQVLPTAQELKQISIVHKVSISQAQESL